MLSPNPWHLDCCLSHHGSRLRRAERRPQRAQPLAASPSQVHRLGLLVRVKVSGPGNSCEQGGRGEAGGGKWSNSAAACMSRCSGTHFYWQGQQLHPSKKPDTDFTRVTKLNRDRGMTTQDRVKIESRSISIEADLGTPTDDPQLGMLGAHEG